MLKLCSDSESDPSCSQLSSALSFVSANWRVELIRKIKITQAEVDVLIMSVKCLRTRPGVDKVKPKVWFKYSL